MPWLRKFQLGTPFHIDLDESGPPDVAFGGPRVVDCRFPYGRQTIW
jgi:hypothetical protein